MRRRCGRGATGKSFDTATLLIDEDNAASLAVAVRTGFVARRRSPRDHSVFLTRPIREQAPRVRNFRLELVGMKDHLPMSCPGVR